MKNVGYDEYSRTETVLKTESKIASALPSRRSGPASQRPATVNNQNDSYRNDSNIPEFIHNTEAYHQTEVQENPDEV